MLSLYHAYQAYEKRLSRGEFSSAPSRARKAKEIHHLPFTFRLGNLLIRMGVKLMQRTQAGHALTSSTMAEK
jgi:hypothetical protein